MRWDEHRSQQVKDRKNNPEKIVDKNNHAFDATAYLFDARPAPYIRAPKTLPPNCLDRIVARMEREERRGKYSKEYIHVA